MIESEDVDAPLDVYDLPQLYQKPTYEELESTIRLLALTPLTFSSLPSGHGHNNLDNEDDTDPGTAIAGQRTRSVNPQGIPAYLTTIVSSSLSWLDTDSQRESIWDQASARLSERSGRNAIGNLTRSFAINDELEIVLHEPSLTGDNLGLKTWSSSLLLARRLDTLGRLVPGLKLGDADRDVDVEAGCGGGCGRDREHGRICVSVLELGAGTGLVGIAAACVWGRRTDTHVVLTDLPEIVPNLRRNVQENAQTVRDYTGLDVSGEDAHELDVKTLDWNDTTCCPQTELEAVDVILAADPIYSPDHPKILVQTVDRWLKKNTASRFIVEVPLRDGYDRDREELIDRLSASGMEMIDKGIDTGYDDWLDRDGKPAIVKCLYMVWKRRI